jgi:hypothetical protein
MSELERARAHLRKTQLHLAMMRRTSPCPCNGAQDSVLAALSWVWEEQEKNRLGTWHGREGALQVRLQELSEILKSEGIASCARGDSK